MSSDEVQVVLIAVGWAALVGIAGLALGYAMRRLSFRWLPPLVAVVAVVAVVAGVIGTAQAMFLSDHDYAVVLWVCAAAGVVAVGFAMAVGSAVVRWSRRLRDETRAFGDSGRVRRQRRRTGRAHRAEPRARPVGRTTQRVARA